MKRISKLLCGALMATTVFSVTSCQKEVNNEYIQPEIGGVSMVITNNWRKAAMESIAKYGKENAIPYMYAVIPEQESANKQDFYLNFILEQKPKVIILSPENMSKEAVESAISGGTKVVFFDTKMDVDYSCYVGFNNKDAGEKAAEFIGSKTSGPATIMVVAVENSEVSDARQASFEAKIKEFNPQAVIKVEKLKKFSSVDALRLFQSYPSNTPAIDAIYAVDDEIGIGVLTGLYGAERTDVKAIAGCGGLQEFYKYIQTPPTGMSIELATVPYSPESAAIAFEAAVNLSRYNTVEQKDMLIEGELVDLTNVARFIDKNATYNN